MMQLIVNIKNESIADEIIWLLKSFQDKGVEIKTTKDITQEEETFSDEYIAQNWRAIGMNTHSADLDDNEIKYDAYARFTDDKYSS